MKKKIFGNSIMPSCMYCNHSKKEGDSQFCAIHRVLRNGKCRRFDYNPIMREPRGPAPMPIFERRDFSL